MIERRLRILIVTTDFPPRVGGIQEWTLQVATHLATRHDVTIVAPKQKESAAYDAQLPFRVVRFPQGPSRPITLTALVIYTLRAVRRAKPDVLLLGHLFAAAALYPVRRWLQIPSIVSTYGHEVHAHRIQRQLPRIIAHSKRCITISRYTAGLLERKGIDSSHIDVIPVGVADQFLTDPPSPPDLSEKHVAPNDRVILTVARLDERYKGHDVMIQAMPLILAQVPAARYVIVGDGIYRHVYEQMAHALNMRDRVVFAGRLSNEERLALYDRCDVFAMISREDANGGAEGFGIVFLEAAARYKPSIGGNSGGIPDAIEDGITGYLVNPTSVADVAETCSRVLANPELARKLGAAGRARVEAGYTWQRIAQSIETHLVEAAQRPVVS